MPHCPTRTPSMALTGSSYSTCRGALEWACTRGVGPSPDGLGRLGPAHCTLGCVRTTDEAMAAFIRLSGDDGIQSISIGIAFGLTAVLPKPALPAPPQGETRTQATCGQGAQTREPAHGQKRAEEVSAKSGGQTGRHPMKARPVMTAKEDCQGRSCLIGVVPGTSFFDRQSAAVEQPLALAAIVPPSEIRMTLGTVLFMHGCTSASAESLTPAPQH